MANNLMVVLGCDCDPDRPRYGGPGYGDRHSALKWRGVSKGISLLRERLQKIESNTRVGIKALFFLRSDTQIEEIHGTAAWPVLEYDEIWRRLESEGHAIETNKTGKPKRVKDWEKKLVGA